MIAIPIHDTILLPEVTFYFKKETFEEYEVEAMSVGDEIAFVFLKDEPEFEGPVPEDKDKPEDLMEMIYPVGVSARLESIDGDGNLKIRTKGRVTILGMTVNDDGLVDAEVVECPDIQDLTAEERVGPLGPGSDPAVEEYLRADVQHVSLLQHHLGREGGHCYGGPGGGALPSHRAGGL